MENNPIFREIVKDIIHSNFTSIPVSKAHDGVEALAEFHHFNPDLIFMDIRLPTMNGLELTKQLKAIDPHTDVVILTNHDTLEYQEATSECGAANHFISKASSIEKAITEVIACSLDRPHK